MSDDDWVYATKGGMIPGDHFINGHMSIFPGQKMKRHFAERYRIDYSDKPPYGHPDHPAIKAHKTPRADGTID